MKSFILSLLILESSPFHQAAARNSSCLGRGSCYQHDKVFQSTNEGKKLAFSHLIKTRKKQRAHRRHLIQRECETSITSPVADPLLNLRGGSEGVANVSAADAIVAGAAAAAAAFVLDRKQESYYMQLLATYGTVTALLLNACLNVYGKTKFKPKRTNPVLFLKSGKIVKKDDKPRVLFPIRLSTVFSATTSLCIISGVFTAVLFNILGIYSKEALSMSNDVGYAAFREATHNYGRWGFRGFLTTCITFVMSLLINIYTKVSSNTSDDEKIGSCVLCGAILISILAGYHIQEVLGMATQVIFTPAFDVQ